MCRKNKNQVEEKHKYLIKKTSSKTKDVIFNYWVSDEKMKEILGEKFYDNVKREGRIGNLYHTEDVSFEDVYEYSIYSDEHLKEQYDYSMERIDKRIRHNEKLKELSNLHPSENIKELEKYIEALKEKRRYEMDSYNELFKIPYIE